MVHNHLYGCVFYNFIRVSVKNYPPQTTRGFFREVP